ncbi:protein MpTCP2 [Marchantia polymorpha subsp. ruderalis]|uniref:TCP domain-containing protein n=2 Tax=Marchantia polymorpha TaxID=3197 RepID=A0A176W872_MARPO|nr:hypothetical protein AXG93_2490s1470 [Marchantia polymorpha subsp. ruderalis]PTQ50290.1 hypothetical protein MARPO_0001s0298 [Marchantia polymorpha]BBM99211.1 hypothetical protein Mp_1g19590 [Marchantia polymorpha subsp. ruderalis]|eukprot:PTQ50290.1 hypothetical protein MARPO_0001s0298 [Marchantia polymorpha]
MLAWARSVDSSTSCHARSTSWRIGFEGNCWPVERDLQDVCNRQCSDSTGYLEVSVRAAKQPQSELCFSVANGSKFESKVDERARDGERFRIERDQIRQYAQSIYRTLADPQAAAVPTEQRSSGLRSSIPGGQLACDVSKYRVQTASANQLHPNSNDSFESINFSPSSPITDHQRELRRTEIEAGLEPEGTRRQNVGEEASDQINRATSLKNGFPLAERASAPEKFIAEGLDDSEPARHGRGGPQNKRSSIWAKNVELVGHGPFAFRENIVECSTHIGVSEKEGFVLHNVIDAQASHGRAKEPTADSGTPRSQNSHQRTIHPQGRQDRAKTANAIPSSPQSQALTDRVSRGAASDALGTDLLPQSIGSDLLQQGTTPARVERVQNISRTRSGGERDVEDTLKGRRYPERIGDLRATTVATAGRQHKAERSGEIPPVRTSQETVVGTAGVLTIPERIGGTAEDLTAREIVDVSESHSVSERVGGRAETHSAQDGGSAEGFTIRERTGGSPSEGNKIPERIGAVSDRDSAGKVQEKGKEEKLHPREEGHQRQSESSDERRLRARIDGSGGSASGGGDEIEEPKVVRPARPSGGKDRHSKVNTAKGPRDRRVRLSVPTAVQFYDVQDRLGFDQPSKAVEWLIHKAKDAIDELGRIPVDGKDGPRVPSVCTSDITRHVSISSSYGAGAVSGLVSGTSSCSPASSFQGPSSMSYGDQLSFLMNPSIAQGMFAPLQPNQGNFAGPTFGVGRMDLTRPNSGSAEGGRSNESAGSPLARVESRTKARERARERTKKGPGRDGNQGKVTSGGSPSSSQSPPFHPNPAFNSFNASNSIQSSGHGLSLQSPHQSALLPAAYDGSPFSRIMQGSHQATFQNMIMHNPPLDCQFGDQTQSPLHNAFLVQPQASLPSPSHTMNTLQHPHLQTMQVNAQGALHLGTNFNPGPCSSSFAEASMSSPHYPPVPTLPISQSLSIPQLSSLGMSPASSLGPHYPTGSPTPIPPGFSPGPPASAFRAHSLSISQCSNPNQNHQQQQQQLQGLSRVQRPVPSFSTTPSTSHAGSSSSRAHAHPYYSGNSSTALMGCLQSMPSFAPRSNVGYEHGQRVRPMMSPNRIHSYQASNSQIPARIHGLDDMEELEEEPNPATPSSPHLSPHP